MPCKEGKTRRRRERQNGRGRDGEAARPRAAPRLCPDSRRREGTAADKPPFPRMIGLFGRDAFSSSGEPAHLTTSGHFMPARRRLRGCRGASACVPAPQACEAAHPRLNGLGVCKQARPRAKRFARRRTTSRLLRRSASAECEADQRRAPGIRRGRAASPADVRARRRMRGLIAGRTGSPSGTPTCRRGERRNVGRTGSPSDAGAYPSAERLPRGARRFAIGRARSASKERVCRRLSSGSSSADLVHPRACRLARG
jgi:hypothetical protein